MITWWQEKGVVLGGLRVDYNVEFYQTESGKVPVMEFLLSLQPKMRAKAYSEIELLKVHGPALRESYVKPIKGKNNQGSVSCGLSFRPTSLESFTSLFSRIHSSYFMAM